jgi:hypothetical protein
MESADWYSRNAHTLLPVLVPKKTRRVAPLMMKRREIQTERKRRNANEHLKKNEKICEEEKKNINEKKRRLHRGTNERNK